MKKFLRIVVAVLWVVSIVVPGYLFAEVAESVQAGVAASVKGAVKATTPPEKRAHSLTDGDAIFMGDKIETGEDGQLQIQLLDETVFTLGPLSTIMVDEFIYDPAKAGTKVGVVKGIFRAVSGKVVQKSTEDVEDGEVSDAVKAVQETSTAQAQEEAAALKRLMDEADAANVGSKASERSKSPTQNS